ncbi:1602_t:CDS:2, partial [Racocetra persica]
KAEAQKAKLEKEGRRRNFQFGQMIIFCTTEGKFVIGISSLLLTKLGFFRD